MTKIGTEVAYVTRDSDTTFKVKRSKEVTRPVYSPQRLCTGSCSGGVGTCWPWEIAATFPSADANRRRHTTYSGADNWKKYTLRKNKSKVPVHCWLFI